MNRNPTPCNNPSASVSHSFIEISRDQATSQPFTDAWQNKDIPRQQLQLVREELSSWFEGRLFPLFDTLVNALKVIPSPAPFPDYIPSILEVGCGVGHYASIIHHTGVYRYVGIDYNAEAIRLAREEWRDLALNTQFFEGEAANLYFQDKEVDVVISSAVLLHMLNWQEALAESARVAKSYLILHRTPIARN